jgi:excisionase family DNA binding protein
MSADSSATAPAASPALLTLVEAARYLSMSRRWVQKQIALGVIPTVRIPGRPGALKASVRFRPADLDACIERWRVEPVDRGSR